MSYMPNPSTVVYPGWGNIQLIPINLINYIGANQQSNKFHILFYLQAFFYNLQMEAQNNPKYASIISVDSKRSNISSCRSLERPSWNSKEHSLSKNRSLIEVMSIEGSRKSDIYEKMLAEDTLVPGNRKSNPIKINNGPFNSSIKAAPKEEWRLSYEKNTETTHICLCYLNCRIQSCPCYDAMDEDCVQDLCCRKCIEVKALRKEKKERIFCTCKKTKCNKKYCTCFSAGVKCGKHCNCQDCANCDKVQKMDIEPVCIVDEQIKALQMPESMQFEPFAFRYSYNS